VKNYYVNVTVYGQDQILNRGPEAAMSFIGSKDDQRFGQDGEAAGREHLR